MRGVPSSLEVRKTYFDGSGRASQFRGWAVVENGVEVSLHYSCTEAYAALEGVDLTHADLELVDPLAGWSS